MRALSILPAVLWAGVIFLLSSRPRLPSLPFTFAGVDKVAHACAYGVLAVLILFALLYRRQAATSSRGGASATAVDGVRALRLVLVATCIACLYGITDELHQAFVPGRTPDIFDLLADVGGALLAGSLWFRLGSHWQRLRRRLFGARVEAPGGQQLRQGPTQAPMPGPSQHLKQAPRSEPKPEPSSEPRPEQSPRRFEEPTA